MPNVVSKTDRLVLVLGTLFSCLLFTIYHNHYWLPADDGVYADAARRLLAGEVPGLDIKFITPGYVHYLHAAELWLFGYDFVSLRYGLIVVCLLGSYSLSRILLSRGYVDTFLAALAFPLVGLLLFINPARSWYCLAIVCLVLLLLQSPKTLRPPQLFLIGILLGVCFFIRQLSGILISISVVSFLLFRLSEDNPKNQNQASKATALIMLLGLGYYLLNFTNLSGAILTGTPAVILLLFLCFKNTCSNRSFIRLSFWILCGALISFLPLLSYLLYKGSLNLWFNDVFIGLLKLGDYDFVKVPSHALWIKHSIFSIAQNPSLPTIIDGLYRISLFLLPCLVGMINFLYIYKNKNKPAHQLALPWLSSIFAVSSLHYQIPVYLYVVLPLLIASFLFVSKDFYFFQKTLARVFVVFIFTWGFFIHAAEPATLQLVGSYHKNSKVFAGDIKGLSIFVNKDQYKTYKKLIKIIESLTTINDPILILPFNAELNFLTGRKSILKHVNPIFEINSIEETNKLIKSMERNPVKIIILGPNKKYFNENTKPLLDYIQDHYKLMKVDDFKVWQALPD